MEKGAPGNSLTKAFGSRLTLQSHSPRNVLESHDQEDFRDSQCNVCTGTRVHAHTHMHVHT